MKKIDRGMAVRGSTLAKGKTVLPHFLSFMNYFYSCICTKSNGSGKWKKCRPKQV
uniref:Uncharacterized protein n=1 Tax=Oryza brachyantha TaxID=4533 RepID=J3MS11_ORYBR